MSRKITQNTAITGDLIDPVNDQLPIVDVSDTTDAASGTTKKTSANDLKNAIGAVIYLSATGTNTYLATPSPALGSYVTGSTFVVNFANANTGAATLNVSSLGAKSIVKRGNVALIGNDIIAESYILFYDGTNFQLIGRAAPFSDANPIIKNASDYTKQAIISAANITTGTTRTYSMLDRDGTISDLPNIYVRTSGRDRYITAGPNNGIITTQALSANSLRAYPFLIKSKISIDRILAEITTGTSGNWRVGIYNDDGTGYPGSLVVDSGQFVVSAPAVFSATISKTLLPGLYWFAYLTDTANTARAYTSASFDNVLGFTSTLGSLPANMVFVALVYTSLPDPFTAGATYSNVAMPIIALRLT